MRTRFLAAMLFALVAAISSYGTTVYVGTAAGDSTTVVAGVSALTDDDTLYVRAGTYTEGASIDIAETGVVVMGEGMTSTIINLYNGTVGYYLYDGNAAVQTVKTQDLTINADSSYIRMASSASGESTITWSNVRFTGGSGDNTTYLVRGDEDMTQTYTSCQLISTSETIWLEAGTQPALANGASGPTYTSCAFTNISFDADDYYAAVTLSGCTGTYSLPTTPGAANFYVFAYTGTDAAQPGAVVIKNCTFTGQNAAESDSLIFFDRGANTVSSDSIYSNTLNEWDVGIRITEIDTDTLAVTGSGTYICDNTMTNIQGFGIVVSTNTGTMQRNTITTADSTTNPVHAIMLGDDSRLNFVDDSTHCYGWDVSANTVSVFNGYALVHKGDYNKVYNNVLTGNGVGLLVAGRDAYFAHNVISGGNFGLYLRSQPADSTSQVPHDNMIKNNIFYALAPYNVANDSTFVKCAAANDDSMNYYTYNTWDANGRTVSRFWAEDATTRTFAAWQAKYYKTGAEDSTAHGIKSGNDLADWQVGWGADTSFVVTRPYNFSSIGVSQKTNFPLITVDFARLEDADSLLSDRPISWAEEDVVVYPVFGGHREKNALRQYEIDRYIATGSDTLFVVPDQIEAIRTYR
jgi:hypothetical protein